MADDLVTRPLAVGLSRLINAASLPDVDPASPHPPPDPVYHPHASAAAEVIRQKLATKAGYAEHCEMFVKLLALNYPNARPEAAVGLATAVWEACHNIPAEVWSARVRVQLAEQNPDFMPTGGKISQALKIEFRRMVRALKAVEAMAKADPRGPARPLLPQAAATVERPTAPAQYMNLPPEIAAVRHEPSLQEHRATLRVRRESPQHETKHLSDLDLLKTLEQQDPVKFAARIKLLQEKIRRKESEQQSEGR